MRTEVRTHRRLAEVAAMQHGVVSRPQLRAIGYSTAAIARAGASGRLHRIHRGVYAVGHARLSDYARCHAALLACGPRALLSHSSAAWLWGLAATLVTPVEVLLPTRGHQRPAIRTHYTSTLQPSDRVSSEGLPVTAVARALLDLASVLSNRSLEWTLERAARLDLLDIGEIDALLARAGRHSGIGALRSALDLYRTPAFTRSGLELRFLELVRASDLPRPAVNTFVSGFELDMYWAAERFAVELDGYETHGTRAAFERDRVRQEELKLAGIEMVRFTARRVTNEPNAVVGRLGALLERRRHELAAPTTFRAGAGGQ